MKVSLNDKTSASDGPELFEKLELTTNEVARMVIPVDDAECVYVHTLEAPVVSGGKVMKEERTRKDKSTYEVTATTFVGRRLCLGDPVYMRGHGGIDENDCPMCAAAKELGLTELIPERRFALPVIRITCTSKTSSEPQDPPGAKIYVLSLTAKQYSGLVENFDAIRELYDWPPEHEVKPNHADIILKCADGEWKRYEWQPPKRRAWAKNKNPELHSLVGRLWGNEDNRPTDEQLRLSCGRMSDRRWVEIDLQKVTDAWAEVRSIERGDVPERRTGQPAETASANADADLGVELDDLDSLLAGDPEPESGASAVADGPEEDDLAGLGEFAPAEAAASNGNGHAPEPADDVPDDIAGEVAGAPDDELFGDPAPAVAKPTAAKAAAAKAAAAKPAAEQEPAPRKDSFDSIMDDL